jgi:NAD(P)-dependent dehydrogenase (short-subunit alcohol dehydrogenase family)
MGIEIDLSGRRILIVGASSGVGRATAVTVAKQGGEVAVVGRRAGQLEELASSVGAVPIPADLRDPDDCARVVEVATERLGGLDAVLFPVGSSPLQLMTRLTARTWADAFATNVVGPALVTAAAVRSRDTPGLFLYVSSANVAQPLHGLGAYGATKAALEHSLRTWRMDRRSRDVCSYQVQRKPTTAWCRAGRKRCRVPSADNATGSSLTIRPPSCVLQTVHRGSFGGRSGSNAIARSTLSALARTARRTS